MAINNVRKEMLWAIQEYIEENKISPTIREVGDMINLRSTATVHSHIQVLKEEGYITMQDLKPRTIRIVKGL